MQGAESQGPELDSLLRYALTILALINLNCLYVGRDTGMLVEKQGNKSACG